MRRHSFVEFSQTWHRVALHLMTRVTIYDLKIFQSWKQNIVFGISPVRPILVTHANKQPEQITGMSNHQQFMHPGKIFLNTGFLKDKFESYNTFTLYLICESSTASILLLCGRILIWLSLPWWWCWTPRWRTPGSPGRTRAGTAWHRAQPAAGDCVWRRESH